MRTRTIMLLGAILTLVLAACGGTTDDPDSTVASMGDESGDSEDTTSTTALQFEDAQLAFADCMRAEDMPVPDDVDAAVLQINGAEVEEEPDFQSLNDTDSVTIDGEEVDTGDFVAAIEACRHLMDSAVAENEDDPELTAEFEDQLFDFARCMRDQGLNDFPDPIREEDGFLSLDISETGLDPESEEFKAAEEACDAPRPPGEEEGPANE